MNISPKGIELIKRFEGFCADPYLCPAGVPTIGYGHTSDVDLEDGSISEAKATDLLKDDVKVAENSVLKEVNVRLYQYEFDALVSFAFNIGSGNFAKSTMLKKINKLEYASASKEFDRWVFAGGKKLPGLVRRRDEERALFIGII